MKIGQVADRTGLKIPTIRFYESKGLIEEPRRRPSGYREYPPEILDRLRFIRRAKSLGFSLTEIRELLSMRYDPAVVCADLKQQADRKIEAIEGRIRELQQIRAALLRMTSDCQGGRLPVNECPILEYLEHQEETS